VRAAAARLLVPPQMAVGVSNPCERMVLEVTAELVHNPLAALLQFDFRSAFNLVSLAAAAAYVTRAFPFLRHYPSSVDLESFPSRVSGCADGDPKPGAAGCLLARRWLAVERGVQQDDPLGPLIHAAAMHLVVLRRAAAHPGADVRAVHDDVVIVAALAKLPAGLTTAAAAGAAVDAELSPAKCAGWSPTGAPASAGWPARWNVDGIWQVSIPLVSDDFVAAGVDSLAADHGRLTAVIVDLSRAELQSQLLLFRLCAGRQPNYWLRALPLVWDAWLAASVDLDAQGAARRILIDARDAPAAVHALLDRAALPLSHGGLGIECRTAIVPVAALTSRIDALHAGRQYSTVLAAVEDSLAALSGAARTGSAPVAPSLDRQRSAAGRSPPPPRRPTTSMSGRGGCLCAGARGVVGSAHGGAALPVIAATQPAAEASPTAAAEVGVSLFLVRPPSSNRGPPTSDASFARLRSLHFPPPKPPTLAARGESFPVSPRLLLPMKLGPGLPRAKPHHAMKTPRLSPPIRLSHRRRCRRNPAGPGARLPPQARRRHLAAGGPAACACSGSWSLRACRAH